MNQRRRLHRAKSEHIRYMEKADPLNFARGMLWGFEQRMAKVKSDEHKKKIQRKIDVWKKRVMDLMRAHGKV